MTTALTIKDQTATGKTLRELTVEFLSERPTVRELIRARVYQEVTEHNATLSGAFQGLVQPGEAEVALNGRPTGRPSPIDFDRQFQKVVEAFEHSRILLLIDDSQVTELDHEVVLTPTTEVVFLRLVMLVGG